MTARKNQPDAAKFKRYRVIFTTRDGHVYTHDFDFNHYEFTSPYSHGRFEALRLCADRDTILFSTLGVLPVDETMTTVCVPHIQPIAQMKVVVYPN